MYRIALTFTLVLILCCTAVLAADVTQLDPDKITQFGIASYHKGDFPTAIRYLSARVRMKPEDSRAYYYLGNCFLKTNQTSDAAHMFSACIRLSPGTQEGKYSLSALETLSTMPRRAEPPPVNPGPDPAQTAASKDALMSEKALDQAFNEAVTQIKSHRQTLKSKIDRLYLQMQEEMQALSPRYNATFAADLERIQREAENKVQDMQTKELRLESRLMAPDKIDVRAVPQLPVEKVDDTKTALGTLLEYFKAEKPFDPFGTDITPELTAKFMTIKDLFGELATYQPSTRRMAKQVFIQLKNSIERKQDAFDQQLFHLKANLIHDVINVKVNYGNVSSQKFTAVTAASFITGAKLPRSDHEQLTPQEVEIAQAVDRAKKRIKELEDSYYRDVDGVIAGAKESLGGTVAQTGQMASQLKKPSGNIQLVPLGTDTYTRNYINFGDRPELTTTGAASSSPSGAQNKARAAAPVALRAQAEKLPVKAVRRARTPAATEKGGAGK